MKAQVKKLSIYKSQPDLTDFANNIDSNLVKSLAKLHGTPLFVLHEDKLRQQYIKLSKALPNVDLHYAIKALPNKKVIQTLAKLGSQFDIATNGEIDLLKKCNIKAQNCIHTHPIKKLSEIQYAIDYGCRFFVVDNLEELNKFINYADDCEIIIRVKYSSKRAVVDLSKKFGCEYELLGKLLKRAEQLNIKISGLSYHVGSQAISPQTHAKAMKYCLQIMQENPSFDWRILDIGGGFPIEYDQLVININDYCSAIRKTLKKIPKSIKVIAEPGRYLVGPCADQIVSIVGKAVRDNVIWYYIDDGVYGSFSGQIYDHAKYPINHLKKINYRNKLFASVIAGPTCDSIDVVDDNIELPNLKVGDILVASQIGAYSMASSTRFNLCQKPKVYWHKNKD